MPNFLVTILISLMLRLLTNEVFLKKILKIIVTKLAERCEERGLTVFAEICRTFVAWLDTYGAGAVLKEVAESMKDKEVQKEIKACVRGCK